MLFPPKRSAMPDSSKVLSDHLSARLPLECTIKETIEKVARIAIEKPKSESREELRSNTRVGPDLKSREELRSNTRVRLSRASLGFELLLAMKHHARRLFIISFQNSSLDVSISVTNFVMIARPSKHIDLLVGHSFVSLYHEPLSTDVVFGRRRKRTSLSQIVSQISATTFELVNSVINSGKGWSFIQDQLKFYAARCRGLPPPTRWGKLTPPPIADGGARTCLRVGSVATETSRTYSFMYSLATEVVV
ncbi:hypothetical protein EVAR_101989_1 [Eumeta japonica]|uniref:Uncharacterized protein n=1 Tax=Eumeta variegata TaxID=151549 RepID=A0A4C1TSU6_EUMVA|nr:hypothetical protein EVAR_101989_1 [Eumeta japonica]